MIVWENQLTTMELYSFVAYEGFVTIHHYTHLCS